MLKKGDLATDKPVLVLSTTADEVLSHNDIADLSKHLIKNTNQPLLSHKVVGSTALDKSAHDVLAAPSVTRVYEAMGHIETWMHANEKDHWH